MRGSDPRKLTLPNGLRVLLAPDERAVRVALCMHYGVGFRSERPGREGFAHLFEHLMFRGSESLPEGRFFQNLNLMGGEANGTTHQDYTDYYQVLPSVALEQAIFSEADRMRAPRFTPDSVAEQLEAVEKEIRGTIDHRPFGGFPWPLLPEVLYNTFANAHDGYGRVELLRGTTPDDCAEFFDRHYGPGNAVITLVGGFDPDHAQELVERHFADIPSRPVPPPPALQEPALSSDRWVTCSEPSVGVTAVALGYRLPDPEQDLDAYLAHVVQAKLLTRYRPFKDSPVTLATSCGFFQKLDARDPDTLLVTSLLPAGIEPQQLVEAVESWWARCADSADLEEACKTTVDHLVTEHYREHAGPSQRARALGRLEVLFGRAELLDELPDRLASLDPAVLAAAAASLRDASKAVLAIEPGEKRTRPDSSGDAAEGGARAEEAAPHRSAEELGSSPEGPRPLPALLPTAPVPRLGRRRDTTLANGLRVVTVRDERTRLVELRLRAHLGPAAWLRPGGPEAIVALLKARTQAHRRALPLGGSLSLDTDGQWLEVAGYAHSSRVDEWLAILVDVVTCGDLGPWPAELPQSPAKQDPARVADDLLRRRWLLGVAADEAAPAGASGAPEMPPAVPGPDGAVIIAVGDLDAEEFSARLEAALAPWAAPAPVPLPSATGGAGEGLLVLPWQTDDVHITLCGPEPAEGPAEPARYLATAVLGAYWRSRLFQRLQAFGENWHIALVGRDKFAHGRRVYVRASAPVAGVGEMLEAIRDEASKMGLEPPDDAEIDSAREFCATQMLSIFDSPTSVADALSFLVAAGSDPDWTEQAQHVLREVSPDEVRAAGAAVFARPPTGGVILGDVDADSLPPLVAPASTESLTARR